MNHAMWSAMREYIASEIRLNALRAGTPSQQAAEEVALLEEQSTRMDTEMRRLIDTQQTPMTLGPDQIAALNMFVRY